ISPSAKVREAAKLLLDNRISAVPVLDQTGNLVGIISEGDLLHRVEAGTERRRSWWLTAFAANDTLAAEFIKAHAQNVSDVMTDRVI
ncbi:CBS domain-containing protein, partial [Acinetobacter baumannii]